MPARLRTNRRLLAGLLIPLLAVAGFADPAVSQDLRRLRGKIAIDGSSTVYPITEAVAEAFKDAAPNVNITVGVSGTGGGFKRFAANETDISDASRPIKGAESAMCDESGVGFLELPVAYDGLTIVVSRSNDWVENLTVDELKRIFLTDDPATTWQDVRPNWPATPLKIYSPGTDSGTFDYFKEVVAGKTGTIRSDMSVSEDDNVLVRGVAGDAGAIGFFGVAYYLANQDTVRAVPIVNKDGKAVSPTPETIEDGSYNPFSRPLFIYVKTKSSRKPHVRAFIDFYLDRAPKAAAEVGYVGLPADLYDRARATFKDRREGSRYLDDSGDAKHGSLREIYR
jgi:phosphate transport system substrate-binding protein